MSRSAAGTALLGLVALALLGASLAVWSVDAAPAPAATARVPAQAAAPPGSAPAASTSPVDRGRTLFMTKGCIGCHARAGLPNSVPAGPDLTAIAAVAGSRRPGLSAEAYVRESIVDPQAFVVPSYPGGPTGTPGGMPRLPVSDAEADDLVAFLLEGAVR